ncbi:MAG: TonB-dependent receptor [Cyclobacteriaceae bacterium]|jgi:TonB-dependent receptor
MNGFICIMLIAAKNIKISNNILSMKLEIKFKSAVVRFVLSGVFAFIAASSYGQSGFVSGKVLSASEEESLPGTAVRLVGSVSQGGVTDINGDFQISNVSIGKQQFEVSYMGFKSQIISLEIKKGNNTLGKILMEDDISTIAELVITGQAYGQQVAINEQLASDAIVNVVSADKIQELPDVNAAEAIARLPGVAINRSGGEGQKVVIRGLEPKFAAITLNGVRLPSNSSDDRSVDLSLISPELLSGIEVFKSPLPNMDAESTAGTVNLKIAKAPSGLRLLAKGLGGYNQLNDDPKDYKGLIQMSNRVLDDKLGVVVQTSIERFNRSGDVLQYDWLRDGENSETGLAENIIGTRFNLIDNQEIRRRVNASLNLDYDLGKGNTISLFGLYSTTSRDRVQSQIELDVNGNGISFRGQEIENSIDLGNLSLSGLHPVGKMLMDWTLSRSVSEGATPYNFNMEFENESDALFDGTITEDDHPRTYLGAANLTTDKTNLRRNTFSQSLTAEASNTALVNFELPINISSNIGAKLKFGAKYFGLDRDRDWSSLAEHFYYIGGDVVDLAQESYGENLTLSPDGARIRMSNFLDEGFTPEVILEDGSSFIIPKAPDPDLMRSWYESQKGNLFTNNIDKPAEKYNLTENVFAFYTMLKLNLGEKLTVIPGFRYEYSDNNYSALVAPDESNGRYGSLQTLRDTSSVVNYGNFFPHLHIKYQVTDWMEVRASYASTIARPDFTRVIPRVEINQASTRISAGNAGLQPTLSSNYDLSFAFFKQGWGLFTFGGFYKDIENLFTGQSLQIANADQAEALGFPGFSGYLLSTQVNFDKTKVYGFEIDLQTNLATLPAPFNGIVINVNYARLYSETQVPFLTSETVLQGFPPIPVTTFSQNIREEPMPSQTPTVFRASLGYDFKGFSFRVSSSYQGTKVRGYSASQDFDRFDLEFWRVDAVIKQRIGENWSAFINLNNLSNQQDIITRSVRDRTYDDEIQTYGITGQVGVQFKMRK